MKKNLLYLWVLAAPFAACTDDYTDWADPQQVEPDSPFSVSFSASEVSSIDLGNVTADSVAIFSPSLTTDATSAAISYQVALDDTHTLTADGQGRVSVSDLSAAVIDIYGQRPTERSMDAQVTGYVNVNGTSIKTSASSVTIHVTPAAPVIESVYYLIGNTNSWLLDETYAMTNGGADVYANPVFTVRVPAPVGEDGSRVNLECKVAPQSAIDTQSWDGVWGCSDADAESPTGTLVVGPAGNNIVQPASDGALYYDVSVNMLEGTYTVTPISFEPYIYIPGNHQGWSPATAQALYSAASDGVYSGYSYLNGEFKFTLARDWNNEYNYGDFTTYSEGFSQGGGSNINMANPGFYQIKADIPNASLTATLISTIGLIGEFNGWGGDIPMSYDETNDCWTVTADMEAGPFKFRANEDWGINFGGTADNLVENGDNLNLTEAGTYTINLYVSRATESNMYCTIEKQ